MPLDVFLKLRSSWRLGTLFPPLGGMGRHVSLIADCAPAALNAIVCNGHNGVNIVVIGNYLAYLGLKVFYSPSLWVYCASLAGKLGQNGVLRPLHDLSLQTYSITIDSFEYILPNDS